MGIEDEKADDIVEEVDKDIEEGKITDHKIEETKNQLLRA